jgi:mRNA interferase RelE/StbE
VVPVLKIKYTKSAVKVINLLNKTMKLRIKNGIEGLTKIPPKGDIKPIQGYEPPRASSKSRITEI